MKLSRYFLPLLKEVPQEAQIISHQLMLRAGMICQEMAGLYSWLPLGTRVLQKVANIIREEQNKINSHEVIMPTLQPADLWKETDRYESYGKEMLRIKDRHDRELIYSPTNEEMITMIFKRFVKSYRQLPCCLYQIHWKFRDEIRPRFGVMRCREFYMKDAYSFDINAVEARKTYYKMVEAYLKTFARMGLTAIPVRADAGPIGGDLSHEFHVIAETGESAIYYDKAFDAMQYGGDINVAEILEHYAAADETHNSETCPVPAENLRESRGIEIGHIFNFGSKYTQKLGALVTDESGQQIAPEGGCYGIGAGRVVAAIIEASHDKYGIIWPESVAPFTLGILNLKVGDSECDQAANDLYNTLEQAGVEVLLDDTKDSPGAKFSRMDLIGLPWQVVVGPKGLKAGRLEVKERKTGERLQLTIDQVLDKFVGAS